MELDSEQKVGFNLEIKKDGLVCYKEPTKGFHMGDLLLYAAGDHMKINLIKYSCETCERGGGNGCLFENVTNILG
jgi:hypothetical protein